MGEKLEDSVVATEVKDMVSSKGKNKERIGKFHRTGFSILGSIPQTTLLISEDGIIK